MEKKTKLAVRKIQANKEKNERQADSPENKSNIRDINQRNVWTAFGSQYKHHLKNHGECKH